MKLQPTSRAFDIDQATKDVDHAISQIDLRRKDLHPPPFGEAQRQAISACVDGISAPLGERIGALHKRIDRIQQLGLQSASDAKAILDNHVTVCQRLDAELRHLEELVKDLEGDDDHGSS